MVDFFKSFLRRYIPTATRLALHEQFLRLIQKNLKVNEYWAAMQGGWLKMRRPRSTNFMKGFVMTWDWGWWNLDLSGFALLWRLRGPWKWTWRKPNGGKATMWRHLNRRCLTLKVNLRVIDRRRSYDRLRQLRLLCRYPQQDEVPWPAILVGRWDTLHGHVGATLRGCRAEQWMPLK